MPAIYFATVPEPDAPLFQPDLHAPQHPKERVHSLKPVVPVGQKAKAREVE